MRRSGATTLAALVSVLLGCSGGDATTGGSDATEPRDGATTFCEAWATTPVRWLDDAVVPIRLAVETFSAARDSVPAEVADEWEQLVGHGDAMLDWNLGRREKRPQWDASAARAALVVADAAVAVCADLPLVVGPGDRAPGRPRGTCDDDATELAAWIDWYTSEVGEPPRHQQQIEAAADVAYLERLQETGEPDVELYFIRSEAHGVDPSGGGAPVPVPGGPCDD